MVIARPANGREQNPAYRPSGASCLPNRISRRNNLLLIELQTNLIHSPNLRRRVRFGYGDLIAAGAGNPQDATGLLLVATVHVAAGHQFERLQPAVDVLRAARGTAGPIDRARMVRVAQATGSATALQSAHDLVARLFAEPAARSLADALDPAPWRVVHPRLLPPAVVLRAQAMTAWRDSWRRRVLREMIRRGGRAAGPSVSAGA